MDIVRARQILEPNIAELAAQNRSLADLKLLAADIEALRRCSGGFEELAKIDTQFHLNVAKASGNSLMPLLLEPIHRLIPEIKSKVYATIEDAKDSAVVWHQRILDQIESQKPAAARKAMAEHLRIAETHAKRMMSARRAKENGRKAS
jgi:GntR family transcriptional repressor for pyruvate dehydrogenase complex